MEPIKSILDSVLKNIEAKQKQHPEGDLDELWLKCVRKKTAKHTKVSFFKSGRLYINVENPGWLYELNINREELLKRLQKVSKNKIKYIKFKVGVIKNGERR